MFTIVKQPICGLKLQSEDITSQQRLLLENPSRAGRSPELLASEPQSNCCPLPQRFCIQVVVFTFCRTLKSAYFPWP